MTRPLAEIFPSFKNHPIEFPVQENFFLVGCSATTFRGKITAAFWASNHVYDTRIGGYVPYVAPPGMPSRAGRAPSHRPPYLVTFTDNLRVEKVEDIVFATPTFEPGGFDGPKPFERDGQLWMDLYSGREGRDLAFFLARLDGATIVAMQPLLTEGGRRGDEKNWMPEIIGGNLRYHYRLGTLIDTNGQFTNTEHHDYSSLNGGTQVVPFNGGGLVVVHDYHFGGGTPGRKYRHYFATIGADGKPTALSEPFVLFDVEKVEVVTGLALHPDGKQLILSHGPFLATVNLDEFANLQWNGVPQNRPSPTIRSSLVRRPHVRRTPGGVKA